MGDNKDGFLEVCSLTLCDNPKHEPDEPSALDLVEIKKEKGTHINEPSALDIVEIKKEEGMHIEPSALDLVEIKKEEEIKSKPVDTAERLIAQHVPCSFLKKVKIITLTYFVEGQNYIEMSDRNTFIDNDDMLHMNLNVYNLRIITIGFCSMIDQIKVLIYSPSNKKIITKSFIFKENHLQIHLNKSRISLLQGQLNSCFNSFILVNLVDERRYHGPVEQSSKALPI